MRLEKRRLSMVVSLLGAVVVGFTLAINLSRRHPVASPAIAALLYGLWIRAGRPRGIAAAAVEAEE